uniref:Uncharacterized protein n=1 Tax=Ditylenchus dipsaci TaxID=166011 RepID=A0A915D3J0_9BILA
MFLSNNAFGDRSVSQSIAYIQAHFSILPVKINKLEERTRSLNNELSILNNIVESSEMVPGKIGTTACDKLNNLLDDNQRLAKLMT